MSWSLQVRGSYMVPRNCRMLGYRDTADILESDKFCYSYRALNGSDDLERLSKLELCYTEWFFQDKYLLTTLEC
jgi:hypothetical protein